MFAIFEKNLLTNQGKSLVREYADNYDAQQIYSELRSYSLESTKALLDSSNLLTYIYKAISLENFILCGNFWIRQADFCVFKQECHVLFRKPINYVERESNPYQKRWKRFIISHRQRQRKNSEGLSE